MPGVDLNTRAGGRHARVTSDEVVEKLRGATPGVIRTHAVRVEGVLYPIKEAFSTVSGLDLLDFNTNQARNWFRKLGFEVLRVEQSSTEAGTGHSDSEKREGQMESKP
jgi:hypothetical protein